ncbi:hypothetical protein [Lysinibacillus boronitolerans]|uniref:Uncharacterized protein n=1 Tax=Lysinibacillus boronitolerans JCM 21713 = 10a = NBRC 103108 TaxID=1294264 RepID=A0ABR4Y4M0_9BACI|nr:hypothetical protein [Lysinibacillus boronitolerans]KGR89080.1 hypothetical protein CD31_01565 [Lysinibacillus boronitolerans JCM 21713 = 10a = NBRC 103108]
MRKITTITTFIHECSYLIDKKVEFSVQEVNKHIENKDVLEWLEKEFPSGSDIIVDFSMFKDSHRAWIHEELYSLLVGYEGQERRKWGIENNGLCLLISWSIEVVRDIHGRFGETKEHEDEWL